MCSSPEKGFGSGEVRNGRNTSESDWLRSKAVRGVVQETITGTSMWLLSNDDEVIPHAVNIRILVAATNMQACFFG